MEDARDGTFARYWSRRNPTPLSLSAVRRSPAARTALVLAPGQGFDLSLRQCGRAEGPPAAPGSCGRGMAAHAGPLMGGHRRDEERDPDPKQPHPTREDGRRAQVWRTRHGENYEQ